MNRLASLLTLLISCLIVGCGSNPANSVNKKAPQGTGFSVREYKLSDGETHKCSVFIPFKYDRSKKWPTIVFLQGIGEGGSDGVKNTTVGLGPAIARRPDSFDFIAVFPQSGGTWSGEGAQRLAIDCLDAASREYSVDPSRVYLTGLSTGGYGVWAIGAKYSKRFAALVPMAAYSGKEFAAQLTKTPIWAFHNGGDPFVWAMDTTGTVEKINELGGNAKKTVYGALLHNCWDSAYGDKKLWNWLRQQHR